MNRKTLSSRFDARKRPVSRGLSIPALALCLCGIARADVTLAPSPVGHVPGAKYVSHLSSSQVLSLSMSLAPANQGAFEGAAQRVSDPRSADYHRFLSPAQVGQRFGASTSTVNAAVSYLKSKGLTVTLQADNRMGILFKGPVSKIELALSTKINLYHSSVRTDDGPSDFFANATPAKVPSSFGNQVVAIGGLSNAIRPKRGVTTLTPTQLRTLYGVQSIYRGNKGDGINIGITNYDGYLLSNVPLFATAFGIPAPTGGAIGSNIHKVPINGDNGEAAAAEGEGDLDIQCVLAMAPSSQIYVYDAGQTFDAVALLTQMAQDNLVDIATESYGFDTSSDFLPTLQALHNQHTAMTLQGITYLACSGDTGTYWPGYPDIDPEVLIVGGTVADTDGDGNRVAENGWNGSGSGYRDVSLPFNVTPSYQLTPADPLGTPGAVNRRFFPDLALHATGSNDYDPRDPRYTGGGFVGGYYWYTGGSQVAGSGTSASCPTLAGDLGVMLQSLKTQGVVDPTPSGRFRLGRLQDFIYTEIGNDPTVFFDVVDGDGGPLPNGSEARGKVGWDFVTGWGSPNIGGLSDAIVSGGSTSVSNAAGTANVYTITNPTLTLGTVAGGDVTSLTSTDGVSYILQSVKQNGLGQVAATTVAVPLQTQKTPRSATFQLSLQIPTKATGYLYLLNKTTNAFDLVSTLAGTGSMVTTTVNLDLASATYTGGSSVTALVRAIQPTRLGTAPFKLSVDQVTVTERVPRG